MNQLNQATDKVGYVLREMVKYISNYKADGQIGKSLRKEEGQGRKHPIGCNEWCVETNKYKECEIK